MKSAFQTLSCFSLLAAFFVLQLRGTNYEMEVRLDAASKIISGVEILHWTNRTAFRDWAEEEWAYNEIVSVILLSDQGQAIADLTSRVDYIQPDNGNIHDRTVMRIFLPEAVLPGATVHLKIEFKSKVPRTFARTGFRGRYFFIAQWFPKSGVFERDGTWNCHQFIQTEFFSDFGTYDVKLTVPAGWVVGATGGRKSYRENDDETATHHYYQQKVHDFAWTTSPHFLEYQERFEHPRLKAVDVRLLLMPDHRAQRDRYFEATRAALKYYGEWFGEYPYGHLTVVDPAYGSRTGGMEYPTLFTGGTRWLNPHGSNTPEGVTVHEAGHQFWYGIVANNEFEDAWLDEGLTSYATDRVMLKTFGPTPVSKRYLDGFLPILFDGIHRTPRTASGLGGYYSDLKLDSMAVASWEYGPSSGRAGDQDRRGRGRLYRGGSYVLNSYTKPALMFQTLERYLGWETFQRVLSTFFERWQFRHPRPQDFFQIANEVSGGDLSWFWQQTYYSSNLFDYAVDGVDSRWDYQEVVVRRWGEGIFPVNVKVTFADGNVVEEKWEGKDRWVRYRYQTEEEIQTVQVDPGRTLALDVNMTNNSWTRDSSAPFAARKWALKWMVWLQNLMELFAFFS